MVHISKKHFMTLSLLFSYSLGAMEGSVAVIVPQESMQAEASLSLTQILKLDQEFHAKKRAEFDAQSNKKCRGVADIEPDEIDMMQKEAPELQDRLNFGYTFQPEGSDFDGWFIRACDRKNRYENWQKNQAWATLTAKTNFCADFEQRYEAGILEESFVEPLEDWLLPPAAESAKMRAMRLTFYNMIAKFIQNGFGNNLQRYLAIMIELTEYEPSEEKQLAALKKAIRTILAARAAVKGVSEIEMTALDEHYVSLWEKFLEKK